MCLNAPDMYISEETTEFEDDSICYYNGESFSMRWLASERERWNCYHLYSVDEERLAGESVWTQELLQHMVPMR
jgi:hypothetical protein